MMHINKIRMNKSCENSNNVQDINSVYIRDCKNPGWYKKEVVHNHLKKNPNSIVVDRYPYPVVIPATSELGEKYVKSTPDDYKRDNLLSLPRE